MDLAPLMERPQQDGAGGRLAPGNARFGRFDAVVHGVADQMRQRIADGFQNGFVQLHFLPFQHQLALLAQGSAQVADHPGKAAEDRTDHLEAGLHDRLLEFGGYLVDPRNGRAKAAMLVAGRPLQQLITGQDQFARQVHKPVQHLNGDANAGLGARSRGALGR